MSKYENSYYIEIASFSDFKRIVSPVDKTMIDALPEIKITHPRLESKTKNGKYFLEVDGKNKKLLDKMMASPSLKSRLLTKEQAQAIAFRGEI